MLSRYQTGPFVTVGFFLLLLLMFIFGLWEAASRHHWNGLLSAVTSLLILFNFHKRFYE